MLIKPELMPADARVWVYQSDRELSPEEIKLVAAKTSDFIESWTAHQQTLHASFEIRHSRFLIIMIDEKQATASGCSIDKSVHFVNQLEKDLNLSFLNRMIYAYRAGELVKSLRQDDFQKAIDRKEITADTMVFNNLVSTKAELDSLWMVPLAESWHSRIFELN